MSLSQIELEELVRRVIALYNRVRSPEVTTKVLTVSSVIVTISFSGGFCYGCGITDYVESFASQFKAMTDKAQLKAAKTRQINPRTFEADYIVKMK